MHKVVVFTENNARILYEESVAGWTGDPRALINPDLSSVHGVPPHFWKREGDGIVPMNEAEKLEREAHIDEYGAHNDFNMPLVITPKRFDFSRLVPYAAFAAGLIAGHFIQ